ncbi:MAG: hypothetical protein RR432_01170 [Alistipes sp.]
MKEFEQSGLASYCLASKDVFEKVIEEVAEDFDTAINKRLLDSYKENLLKGVRGVFDSQYGDRYFDLQNRLEANVGRFAAYKAYHATEQVRRQLTGKGSKEECLKRAKGALGAFNRYQAVEYNTTIARCRTAKQWTDYNTEESLMLFPNLRWLPSRAAEPRPSHIPYYNRVWPKNHPFWLTNQPGSEWGCACDWEETLDDSDFEGVPTSNPPKGLEGNPGETGKVFSDKSIYFTANNHEKVGQAILESGEGGYYTKGNIPKVQAKAHVMHHPGEVAGNMEVASVFCGQNKGVKSVNLLPNVVKENGALRPNFYPKNMLPRGVNNNADSVIEWANGDKWVVDFKYMSGNGGKLKDRLLDAYQQADYAVVKITGEIKSMADIQDASIAFMKSHPKFKGLIIYNKLDEELVRIIETTHK